MVGGQQDGKRTSLPDLTLDADRAVVVLDDSGRDGQTQACPYPNSLGGEARIKDSVEMFLTDATPGIGNGNLNLMINQSRGDANLPLTGDRLVGINEQIHEHLIQLTSITDYWWQLTILFNYLNFRAEETVLLGFALLEQGRLVPALPAREEAMPRSPAVTLPRRKPISRTPVTASRKATINRTPVTVSPNPATSRKQVTSLNRPTIHLPVTLRTPLGRRRIHLITNQQEEQVA